MRGKPHFSTSADCSAVRPTCGSRHFGSSATLSLVASTACAAAEAELVAEAELAAACCKGPPKKAALPELDVLAALSSLAPSFGAGWSIGAMEDDMGAGAYADCLGAAGGSELAELAGEVRMAEGESKYRLSAVSTSLLLLRRLRSNLRRSEARDEPMAPEAPSVAEAGVVWCCAVLSASLHRGIGGAARGGEWTGSGRPCPQGRTSSQQPGAPPAKWASTSRWGVRNGRRCRLLRACLRTRLSPAMRLRLAVLLSPLTAAGVCHSGLVRGHRGVQHNALHRQGARTSRRLHWLRRRKLRTIRTIRLNAGFESLGIAQDVVRIVRAFIFLKGDPG